MKENKIGRIMTLAEQSFNDQFILPIQKLRTKIYDFKNALNEMDEEMQDLIITLHGLKIEVRKKGTDG